jgi:hypothetical protein
VKHPSDADLLTFGTLAECADIITANAEAAFDFAVDHDEAALGIALERIVLTATAMKEVWWLLRKRSPDAIARAAP